MLSKYATFGMLGKNHSEETKRKIALTRIGKSSWNKGMKMNEESRLKMIASLKGKIPWNKGLTINDPRVKKNRDIRIANGKQWHSEETKKKLSIAPHLCRDKHPNWKGGITPLIRKLRNSQEYKIWRSAVFKRDNWTCTWCSYKGNRLQADHIKSFSLYPDTRFIVENGRTLCEECHKKTSNYCGKGQER